MSDMSNQKIAEIIYEKLEGDGRLVLAFQVKRVYIETV
jgi:hypothetical protein